MTTIYHTTHLSHIASIAASGLWCDRSVVEQRLNTVSCAHGHIKQRRLVTAVPCYPGTTLADYVPFYFAPRSPMLYALHKGSVAGYAEGQRPLVPLAASLERVACSGCTFCFTDGHPVIAYSEFYTGLDDLSEIDWELMRSTYWSDTRQDPDRRRRRQAEFLVLQRVPWHLIEEIGVYGRDIGRQVVQIVPEAAPIVTVHREWYY